MASAFGDLDREQSAEDVAEFRIGASAGMFRQPADVATLTLEEMAAIYEYRGVVDAWWKRLGERLEEMASAGVAVPGMKLVEGRAFRKFINERQAGDRLIALGVPASKVRRVVTCSPAESEALLRAAGHSKKDIPNLLEGFVRRPPGKPTLVSVRDKRPALADKTEGAFDTLD